ncbi:hypothetical protein EDD37DRAFT_614030 [Exophiala viscosa]|uniref:uncharacterized protein n=1 Tax=Exophiala viscosa TaxID=2486360 RepID=UPI00219BE16E|nr:hypothetical protein EDD37DRAFT_614030 [Exophiala viscosa]
MALQSLQRRLDATTEDRVDRDGAELAGWLLYHRPDILSRPFLSTTAAENLKSCTPRRETLMASHKNLPSIVGPEDLHKVGEAPQPPRDTGTLDSKMKMLVWDVQNSRSIPLHRPILANRPDAQRRLDLQIHNIVRTWATHPILASRHEKREEGKRWLRYRREEYQLHLATGVPVEEWERHRKRILEKSVDQSNGTEDTEQTHSRLHHPPEITTLPGLAGLDSAADEVCRAPASRRRA